MSETGRKAGCQAALSGAFAVGNFSAITLPIWVPQMGGKLQASISSMGLLGSGELRCVAAAAFAMSRLLARTDARQVAGGAIGGIAIANLLSIVSGGFDTLLLARVLAGLSSGALLAVTDGVAGASSTPQRTFALMQLVLVATVIAIFVSAPYLVGVRGPGAVFGMFALLALICLPLMRYMPRVALRRPLATGKSSSHESSMMIALAVVAIGACFIGQSAVWTYTAGIGVQIGLEPTAVSIGPHRKGGDGVQCGGHVGSRAGTFAWRGSPRTGRQSTDGFGRWRGVPSVRRLCHAIESPPRFAGMIRDRRKVTTVPGTLLKPAVLAART